MEKHLITKSKISIMTILNKQIHRHNVSAIIIPIYLLKETDKLAWNIIWNGHIPKIPRYKIIRVKIPKFISKQDSIVVL